jgi:hypothetical protein
MSKHKTYVTFGQVHEHHVNGKHFDKDCVAVVYAEGPHEGRDLAFKLFDGVFHRTIQEEDFDPSIMQYFPRGLIDVNAPQEKAWLYHPESESMLWDFKARLGQDLDLVELKPADIMEEYVRECEKMTEDMGTAEYGYPRVELFQALYQVFIIHESESIKVDSNPHDNQFRYAAINFGLDQELIYFEKGVQLEQEAQWYYRPTDKLLAMKEGSDESTEDQILRTADRG